MVRLPKKIVSMTRNDTVQKLQRPTELYATLRFRITKTIILTLTLTFVSERRHYGFGLRGRDC